MFGLLWIFLLDPLALTVAWWASVLISLPFVALVEGSAALARKSRPTARATPKRVRELQALYANRVAFGATLFAEFREIDVVYGQLRDLGYDADQALVDAEKAKHSEPWMLPGLAYHEPHLRPQWFDENRPDRK